MPDRLSPWRIFAADWKSARSAMLIGIGAMLVAQWVAAAALAETWAQRLGYPADRKVLIMHANDMGLCYETNAAIAGAMDSGSIGSASAIVPSPWFPDAARWSAQHRDADVGLELTVNSELEDYRWGPVANASDVATLLDPDRFFWPTTMQTMVNASADDVERELNAQLAFARARGLKPSHLTTHLGALVTRADLIEVYLRVARQQWIPAVVVEVTPELLERFRSQGFPLPDELVQLFDAYPLPKLDDLRIVPPADDYQAMKKELLATIRDAQPGLTQVATRPAIESEALKRIAPDWQHRVWSDKLLADDDVKKALNDEEVILTNWREVMRRFEGRPENAEKPATNGDDSN